MRCSCCVTVQWRVQRQWPVKLTTHFATFKVCQLFATPKCGHIALLVVFCSLNKNNMKKNYVCRLFFNEKKKFFVWCCISKSFTSVSALATHFFDLPFFLAFFHLHRSPLISTFLAYYRLASRDRDDDQFFPTLVRYTHSVLCVLSLLLLPLLHPLPDSIHSAIKPL